MQGLILAELERFAREHWGPEVWAVLLGRADLAHRSYRAGEAYPDEELSRLVTLGAEMAQIPAQTLLERFGEFVAPALLREHGARLRPEWRTLDVIANTEQAIHEVIRRTNPEARPPRLRTLRLSPGEVTLAYASPRRLCALARGIGRGIATHFGDPLTITESECMHRGAPACIITFRTGR